MAINYMETEENGLAEEQFNQSIKSYMKVHSHHIANYLGQLQELYNNWGYMKLNRGDHDKGLGLLQKSQ